MKNFCLVAATAAMLAQPCPANAQTQKQTQTPASAPLAKTSPSVGTTLWRLATGYRDESFHTQNLREFASEIESGTGGRVKIEIHSNNSLIKLADITAAVAAGKIEAGEAIMTGMGKEMPLTGADSVPFVVASYAAAQQMWTLQRPGIDQAFAARGLKPLFAVPWPPQGLYTNKPITTTQDLKNLNMRTYNPTTVRIAQLLGASPVDVPMPQVGQALAEGRLDAMITSAVTGAENKVWTGLTHYYELNAWFPKNIVFVNSKAFAQLPSHAQQVVADAAVRAQARGQAMSQVAANRATDILRLNGMKVEGLPFELGRDLRRMGETFSREWVTSVGHAANDVFIPLYGFR